MKRLALYLVGVCLGLTLLSCGGGGGSEGGLEPGTLGILMVDGPPDPSITNVYLEIDRVEAFLQGHWVRLAKSEATIDLLEHIDVPALIADGNVSPGPYSRLKVFIGGCRVVDADGEHEATLPMYAEEGTPIELPFTVHAGNKNEVLMDFNVHRSLDKVGPGQYNLRPHILAVRRNEAGSVFGLVSRDGCELDGVRVRALYEAGDCAVPGSEMNDSITRNGGEYRIWALPPGTYRLEFQRLDGFGNALETVERSGIEVRAGCEHEIPEVEFSAAPPPGS